MQGITQYKILVITKASVYILTTYLQDRNVITTLAQLNIHWSSVYIPYYSADSSVHVSFIQKTVSGD